ncbi:hypothetical protein ABPG72_004856 [Tetrahymena utriculariae]
MDALFYVDQEILESSQYFYLKKQVEILVKFYKYLKSNNPQNKIPYEINNLLTQEKGFIYKNGNLTQIHQFLTKLELLDIDIVGQIDLSNQDINILAQSIKLFNMLRELKLKLRPFSSSLQNIFTAIGQLKFLEKLDLDLNGQYGNLQLLSKLRQLKQLKIIIKSDSLCKQSFSELCSCFQNFQQLQFFKFILSENSIEDKDFIFFCDSLQQLINLECLDISIKSVQITKKSLFQIGQSFQHFKKLSQLSMQLSVKDSIPNQDFIFKDIFQNLNNLLSLALDFSYYKIELNSIYGIFQSISCLEQLKLLELKFDENKIDNETALNLGNIFSKTIKLRDLYLLIGSENQITNQGMINICQGLSQLQCLENLKLIMQKDYQLDALGWNTLFEGITSIKFLITLELQIQDPFVPVQSISILGQRLKNLTLLKRLEIISVASQIIENNPSRLQLLCTNFNYLHNLSDLTLTIPYNSSNIEGFRVLSNSLNQLCNLINLSMIVQQNNIQLEGASCIAQGLRKLINLKSLCLDIGSKNYVKSLGIQKIGESIGCLIELQRLQLTINSENYVEHCGSSGLAGGITKLLNLKELSLFFYDNYINSDSLLAISTSFRSLQLLEELNLFIGYNNYVMTTNLSIEIGLYSLINLKKFSLNVDSRNRYHYLSYIQLIKALSKLQRLIDLSLNIYPIDRYLEELDSQLIFDEIKNLKGLQKLKIFTPFKPNFQILALIEELPQLQQKNIDFQYFKSIQFEREFFFFGKLQLKSRVKKLILDILDNENNGRNFCSFYGLDRALEYYSHITHFEFNFIIQNLITNQGAQLLARGIKANLNLQSISLNFDKNQVCSLGLKSLSISLRELKNLTQLELNFEKNQIESDAAIELGKLLEQTQLLESLVLNFNNNKIKTEGAFKICRGISKCSKIKDLVLMFKYIVIIFNIFIIFQNKSNIYLIYDDKKYGLQPLGIQISKCSLLKKLVLDLGSNSNCSYNELFPILANCTKLRHLQFDFDSKTTEFQLKTELNQFYLLIERANYINYLSLKIENYTFGTQGGQLLIKELLRCKNLMALELNLIETNISNSDFESLILESRRSLHLSQFYCTLQQSWLTQLQNKKNKYQYLFKKCTKMVQYSLIFIQSF